MLDAIQMASLRRHEERGQPIDGRRHFWVSLGFQKGQYHRQLPSFRCNRKRGGAIVKSVRPNSQAATTTVERGHVILRVGGVDVQSGTATCYCYTCCCYVLLLYILLLDMLLLDIRLL